MAAQFELEILTPERQFFVGLAEAIVLPSIDGSYGVQAGHEPVVIAVEPGELQYQIDGTWHRAAVGQGFAEIMPEYVILLAATAEHPEEIDEARARRAKERAEEAARKAWREQFDVASARGVARLNMLAEYCLPLVKPGGVFIAMKAATAAEELAEAKGAIAKLGGEYSETRRCQLPQGDERNLVVVRKISQTPPVYPRNGGKIAKAPLK